MDPLWTEVLKQAPQLGVLTWLVVFFLRHIKDERAMQRSYDRERTEALVDVLERNNAALDKSSVALGQSLYVIERHGANGRAK